MCEISSVLGLDPLGLLHQDFLFLIYMLISDGDFFQVIHVAICVAGSRMVS